MEGPSPKMWSPPEEILRGQNVPNTDVADHDLKITIRILPKLQRYYPTYRHGLSSRGWGKTHDGYSYRIEKVEKLEKDSVIKSGRKKNMNSWFRMSRIITKEMKKAERQGASADVVMADASASA